MSAAADFEVAPLRAPFPYFGGKRRIATRVWEALGDVRHYVEPFCGSAAVLLARPHKPSTETVNDADGMVCNFWRAVKAAPDEVARHADWPVIATDLRARHRWLLAHRDSLTARLEADPEFYDAKVAGWWAWGGCAAIGDVWHRLTPQVLACRTNDVGVLSLRRSASLTPQLEFLSSRLSLARIESGDFARVLGPSNLFAGAGGLEHRVGVYLDPPYSEGDQQYAAGGTGTSLSARARAWCEAHDRDERLRIVLSGYEGEHAALEARGWTVVAWKSAGGYSSRDGENKNQKRERLWLSPHCLRADHGPLFGGAL